MMCLPASPAGRHEAKLFIDSHWRQQKKEVRTPATWERSKQSRNDNANNHWSVKDHSDLQKF